jgi:uncharacterized protein YbaA (DUF1428 family)
MSQYVDGFVLPVRRDKIAVYQKIARKAAKVWKEHGALEYRECVGEDMDIKEMFPFPRMIKVKPDEVPVFAYIVFKSRAHRDAVNAKVMADPRLGKMMDPKEMPFECKRMAYGGFETIVYA